MIFLIMVLVILVFVVLWTYDLHKILYGKAETQNAGDAAAVAAARWQGISLNLVGDLNLLHALALVTSNTTAAASITNIQARILFTGPLVGLMAAQQAAKNNGIYANDAFTERLQAHAEEVRSSYGAPGADGTPLFPEPYDGAWKEYADMLDAICADGIAAGPDNAHMYTDYSDDHPLLMIDFYEAIAGKNWCWFHLNEPGLLEGYQDFQPCWWDALPPLPDNTQQNSEIFGLGLVKRWTSLDHLSAATAADTATQDRYNQRLTAAATTVDAAWYCFGSSIWSNWAAMSLTGENHFPGAGPVKPQYDYAGADAAIRIEASIERVTPGVSGVAQTNAITWTAAAKPFGAINGTLRPDTYGLVLPVFDEARLIPVDASSTPSGGSFNLLWQRHIHDHLPYYMEHGPDHHFACMYCDLLATWESDAFRQSAVDWLKVHGNECHRDTSGGPGGGSRTGH